MARAILFTNPDGVPYVEHEHNGVDPDELAADLARAGFTEVRVVEAIEETQHDHGSPLVVLGCLMCKGGAPTPVLVCPICALITAQSPPSAAAGQAGQAQPAGDTQTATQAQQAEDTEPSRRLPVRWFQERASPLTSSTAPRPPLVAATRYRDHRRP